MYLILITSWWRKVRLASYPQGQGSTLAQSIWLQSIPGICNNSKVASWYRPVQQINSRSIYQNGIECRKSSWLTVKSSHLYEFDVVLTAIISIERLEEEQLFGVLSFPISRPSSKIKNYFLDSSVLSSGRHRLQLMLSFYKGGFKICIFWSLQSCLHTWMAA